MHRLSLLIAACGAFSTLGCATDAEVETWSTGRAALEATAQADAVAAEEAVAPDEGGPEVAEAGANDDDPLAPEPPPMDPFEPCEWMDCDMIPGGGDDDDDDDTTGGGGGGGSSSNGDGDGDGDDGGTSGSDDGMPYVAKVVPVPGSELHPLSVLDCFELQENDGLSHAVTVYVRQPDGADKIFDFGDQDFGHVWIGIEQSGGVGGPTRRMVGMHPDSEVRNHANWDLSWAHLRDEAPQLYHVAVRVELTPAQFRAMTDRFQMYQDADVYNGIYHMSDRNSVHHAQEVFDDAGIALPLSYVNGLNYEGLAPGPFGAGLRSMNLPYGYSRTTDGWSPGSNANCVDAAPAELQEVLTPRR